MKSNTPTRVTAALLGVALLCASAAFAAGGGSMPSGSSMPSEPRVQTPEELARDSYNQGVKLIRTADDAVSSSEKAKDAAKKQKSLDKAKDYYGRSLGKFESAVAQAPTMYEAWNYIGYAKRHLGDYNSALAAYERALTLNPKYPEAIEYRGHAYLGLNRLGETKDAYLALFPANRKLAAQLLTGMQAYVAAHHSDPAGVDAKTLEEFAKWVDERVVIAGQTTALTRDGAASSWH